MINEIQFAYVRDCRWTRETLLKYRHIRLVSYIVFLKVWQWQNVSLCYIFINKTEASANSAARTSPEYIVVTVFT